MDAELGESGGRETLITSPRNPRMRELVRLRKRAHRDSRGLLLIEGYRELKRALDNDIRPTELYYCTELFQGGNESILVERCRSGGADIFRCSEAAFRRVAYRDRPEGLLAVAYQLHRRLEELPASPKALYLVAEGIEKPGNLGSILRSADAAGAEAVIVCDRGTDINNPNVVRASIGTLFSVPVVEAESRAALRWLREHGVRTIAATPHADTLYTRADMRGPVALVVGSEQYGLTPLWLEAADEKVYIPMLGQADSLNVAAAATILLFEAVRQRQGG